MTDGHSDGFVFFGATGDLAYKNIFPALQAMVKRGHLDAPIIGVRKAGWRSTSSALARAKSVKEHGGLNAAAFDNSAGCCAIRTATTAMLRRSRPFAGSSARPSARRITWAIPPTLFRPVVEQLARSGCAKDARVIVEKRFRQGPRLRAGPQPDAARLL
jgi:glucose-6-phosphate 1-dehydrogenase